MFSNGTGRSYGGGVVHCVSQEPQSNARHPQKSPNLQTWEMWANMFHTKICNHNCWSEVAGPIHRGVEKPQKPTILQPHLCAFGQIHKKCTFLQHVHVLLLSFKANLQVKCSQDHQMTLGQQMESNNCIEAELSVPRCFGVRQHGRRMLNFSHIEYYQQFNY